MLSALKVKISALKLELSVKCKSWFDLQSGVQFHWLEHFNFPYSISSLISFLIISPPAVSPVYNFSNPFSFSNKSQLSAHDPEPSVVFSLFASTLSGNQPKVFTLGRTAKKPCRSYPNEPITVFTLGRTAKKPPQSCPNEPITVFSLGRAAKKVTQCDSHIQAGSRVNRLINLFEFGKSYPPSPFRFDIVPKNDE